MSHSGYTSPKEPTYSVEQPTPRAHETKLRHGLRLPVAYPQNSRFLAQRKEANAAFWQVFIWELVLWFLLRNTEGILQPDKPVHLTHFIADRYEFPQLLARHPS